MVNEQDAESPFTNDNTDEAALNLNESQVDLLASHGSNRNKRCLIESY